LIDHDKLLSAIDNARTAEEFQALVDIQKEYYKTSLFNFCKFVLGFSDVTKDTHGDILNSLQRHSKRKLIVMPRGCLKSTLACVGYPIWLLINDPNHRILIDSELYTNSTTFIREIKAHLESPKLTNLFGQFKGPVWNSDEIIIQQRTRNYKEASIIAGGVGTTRVGQHHSVIIGDDYNSHNNTNSVENAEKVIDHYRRNISILEPDGTYVIIGTRYHTMDVIAHILDNEDHNCTFNYKGL
jgi:hypothetical protein